MLSDGLDYGTEYVSNFSMLTFHELINDHNLDDPSFCIIGYGCESSRNSFEAYIWREESIYLLSDVVLYNNCHRMLSYANQLLEQGTYYGVWTSVAPTPTLVITFILFIF